MSKKNLSIMDRIKTFEDAVKELGEKHPAVCEYNAIVSAGLETSMSPDILAYFKLRIITAALNEGWEPQFTVGEYRYWPWFWLYTQEEVNAMTEAERSELLFVGATRISVRHAVFRLRARITLSRARTRTSVLVWPSNLANSRSTLVASS